MSKQSKVLVTTGTVVRAGRSMCRAGVIVMISVEARRFDAMLGRMGRVLGIIGAVVLPVMRTTFFP